MTWVGLGLIFVLSCTIRDDMAYPGWFASLPVAGAALVIIGGTPVPHLWGFRTVPWLTLCSHWVDGHMACIYGKSPVLVVMLHWHNSLGFNSVSQFPIVIRVGAILVCVFLAALSYSVFEMPNPALRPTEIEFGIESRLSSSLHCGFIDHDQSGFMMRGARRSRSGAGPFSWTLHSEDRDEGPAVGPPIYPEKIRRKACELVLRDDRRQHHVAAGLGIPDQTLNNWLMAENKAKGPGRGPECGTSVAARRLGDGDSTDQWVCGSSGRSGRGTPEPSITAATGESAPRRTSPAISVSSARCRSVGRRRLHDNAVAVKGLKRFA